MPAERQGRCGRQLGHARRRTSVGLPGEHVGDDGCDACTVTESGEDDRQGELGDVEHGDVEVPAEQVLGQRGRSGSDVDDRGGRVGGASDEAQPGRGVLLVLKLLPLRSSSSRLTCPRLLLEC